MLIKEKLQYLVQKILKRKNSPIFVGIIVYFLFVILGIIVLHFGAGVVGEEGEYANVAVGILDGITKQVDIVYLQIPPRQGAEILLSPIVALVFLIFGESDYVLQKIGVFLSGFWALVWFLVACQLFGKKQIWSLATIFIVATPLIHTHHEGVISIVGSHMGVSILFGASLLLLLKTRNLAENITKKGLLALSGAIYLLSFFYGHIILLFFPVFLILFLKSQLGLKNFSFWFLGFLVPFFLLFNYFDINFLKGIIGRSPVAGGINVFETLSSFINFLLYFGGIPVRDFHSVHYFSENPYSILSVFYLVFLLFLFLYYFYINFWKKEKSIEFKKINSEFFAFFLGPVFFLLAISLSYKARFDLPFFVFMHYLIPLIPFYLLALCYFFIKGDKNPLVRKAFIFYIIITIFVLASFLYPFEMDINKFNQNRAFSGNYILIYPKIAPEINLKDVEEGRLGAYSFVMGRAYVVLPNDFYEKKREIERQIFDRSEEIKKHTLKEFIRGYYHQKVLQLNSCEDIKKFLRENKNNINSTAAQGIGMGMANLTIKDEYEFDSRCFDEIYVLFDKNFILNLGWGYGRYSYHGIGCFDFLENFYHKYPEFYKGILRGRKWAYKNPQANYISCVWQSGYFDLERKIR